MIKTDANDDEQTAMILRGREIAYEAANTPTIPPSMPNYTRDEIRELYGELDKKTRRLQDDEHSYQTPLISPTSPKQQWKLASSTNTKLPNECPLPKFRLEKTPEKDEALLMAAYLSTGLTNPRIKSIAPVDHVHTVMMNASAKVNEWAHNNELYLAPVHKNVLQPNFHTTTDDSTTVNPSSSSLLLDVKLNLQQAAGTPTDTNNRPTFLEGIQQVTTNESNKTNNNQENRRSIKRQHYITNTISSSSSPDPNDIALETTPSTPGSCGMYLEPYMRRGYDLPSADHHLRDSSWQHTDNDDVDNSVISMKDVSFSFSKHVVHKMRVIENFQIVQIYHI